MVAYSFRRQFVHPIQAGLGIANQFGVVPPVSPKRQTIRAYRKRHARLGEELQLYCGMRTKHCFLIGRARCVDADFITLDFTGLVSINRRSFQDVDRLDEFARSDGFADFVEMRAFWAKEHGLSRFNGVIIRWEPLA